MRTGCRACKVDDMSIMKTLYEVADRNDAPQHVRRWIWETNNAPDRDTRLAQLAAALEQSLA